MKNVWESCTFSDEIISGNLDVSKFAVELHNILDSNPSEDVKKKYINEADSLKKIADGFYETAKYMLYHNSN